MDVLTTDPIYRIVKRKIPRTRGTTLSDEDIDEGLTYGIPARIDLRIVVSDNAVTHIRGSDDFLVGSLYIALSAYR